MNSRQIVTYKNIINHIKLNNMRKIIMLLFLLSAAHNVFANVTTTDRDTTSVVRMLPADELLYYEEPAYLKGVLVSSPWTDNWFIQVTGGATAFLGKPLGCNDLFGRIKPAFHLAAGKWFTPSVGLRIRYGGMQFKDCNSLTRDYGYMCTDFMWNVLGTCTGNGDHTFIRWGVIPYVGAGMVHNRENEYKSFALSYGIQGQYRLSERLAVIAEIGNMTTMQDFDASGKSGKFGDNFLSASLGISVSLGRVGWKRAVDARPYIIENERLFDYATSVQKRNEYYCRQHETDMLIAEQFKKILSIEGLLDKYGQLFDGDADSIGTNGYPKNNYSGLNSLRARMNGRSEDLKVKRGNERPEEAGNGTDEAKTDYLEAVRRGETGIGAPVYFFFELGTDRLIDASQLVNVREVARIAARYGLFVEVTGAADSATGTEDINVSVSKARAEYIVAELVRCGMDVDNIASSYEGGIDEYSPDEANRHTRIVLYYTRKQ